MPERVTIATAAANTNHETPCRERHVIISRSLEKAIYQLNHPYYISHKDRLRYVLSKCVSFPKNNNNNNIGKGNKNGKPHDVETRIAITLYHQWKRDAIVGKKIESNGINNSQQIASNKKAKTLDISTEDGCASTEKSPPFVVTITSDIGFIREVSSPQQLANLISPLLEEDFRNNPQWNMTPDVRPQASGIVSMISSNRSQMMRLAGSLPCPECIQWCKGEKGLWWHQQQYHNVEHSSAIAVAQATTINIGAMVLYEESNINLKTSVANFDIDNDKNTIRPYDNYNPVDYIVQGNLDGLKGAVQNHGYQPSIFFDAKGATPLLWAAGGGHLDITRYLIEDCNCNPCQSQRGKRSFAGRTALHWAARNGHLEVVRYLLTLTTSDCSGSNYVNDQNTKFQPIPINKLLEAKTQDGTTAIGWACWQRNLQVMECLYQHNCDIHVLNNYGCSPVLWCSQGTNGNGLDALKWLRERGCNMKLVNHNGHGVLHKAAQRGQRAIAEWLIREECGSLIAVPTATSTYSSIGTTERNIFLTLVGPDIEGYCPSDLAGMEGHDDFAKWLVTVEIRMCRALDCIPFYEIPAGYSSDCASFKNTASTSYNWEKYGGLRRIRSAVM